MLSVSSLLLWQLCVGYAELEGAVVMATANGHSVGSTGSSRGYNGTSTASV